MPFPYYVVSTNTNIGPSITLLDFENQSRQRIDSWFAKITNSLYGDAFSVASTAAQSIPASTVSIIFCNSGTKTNNCWDGSIFTATKTGFYQFNVYGRWTNSFADGDVATLSIYQNGGVQQQSDIRCYANDVPTNVISTILVLEKGDTIKVFASQSTAIAKLVAVNFSGCFVRPL